jgi:hypothetical protein
MLFFLGGSSRFLGYYRSAILTTMSGEKNNLYSTIFLKRYPNTLNLSAKFGTGRHLSGRKMVLSD